MVKLIDFDVCGMNYFMTDFAKYVALGEYNIALEDHN